MHPSDLEPADRFRIEIAAEYSSTGAPAVREWVLAGWPEPVAFGPTGVPSYRLPVLGLMRGCGWAFQVYRTELIIPNDWRVERMPHARA